MGICRKNEREAHSRPDEVYFDLGLEEDVEGVEGLLGWKDLEMVVAS
jgi:hypothetical protein